MRRAIAGGFCGLVVAVIAGAVGPSGAFASTQLYQATVAAQGGDAIWNVFVNPLAQVTASSTGFDNQATWGYLYSANTQFDLRSAISCGTISDCEFQVTSINGSGQISGWISAYNSPPTQAFRYDHGTGKLTYLKSGTEAWYVNAQGQLIGTVTSSTGTTHGFLWDGSKIHTIGTLGGAGSVAYAGISKNQAVGCAQTKAGAWHPIQYSGGTVHDLGLPPGLTSACAYGEGPDGTIVGGETPGPWPRYLGLGDTACHAWYRTPTGTYHTITPPIGSTCINAHHVNAHDQIVGGYTTSDGNSHPYVYQNGVFTPIQPANIPFDSQFYALWEASGNNPVGQLGVEAYDPSLTEGFALLLSPITVTDNPASSVSYNGSWSTVTNTAAYGNSLAVANAAGATATFTFSGRTFAMIGPCDSQWASGTYTVDSGPSQTAYEDGGCFGTDRQRIIALSWPSAGTHTIKITSSAPGFALDAFTVSAN
jgi:probable HAF family extracellular repeat protein